MARALLCPPSVSRQFIARIASVLVLGLVSTTPCAAQTDQKTPWFVKVPLATYVTADMADMATTGAALSRGAREANPFLRPLSGHPALLGFVNGATMAVTTYAILRMSNEHPKRAAIVASILATIEVTVVRHNLDVIRRSR